MSDLQFIESTLLQTARRQRRQNGWRGLWQGLFIGAAVWLLALLTFKLAPIPETLLGVAGILALTMTAIGFVWGWRRRPTLPETARWIDQRQSLQERLSTALEFSSVKSVGEWQNLIVADAARCVPQIDVRQLLPYRLPNAAKWSVLLLALAAGLGFVPEYRTTKFVQTQNDADAIKKTGQQLAEFTRRSLEARPPALEANRQAMDTITELGDHLAKAPLTRAEALKDISSVTEKLKDQVRELGRNPALKSMEKAARGSSERGGTPGPADLQKKLDELQQSLENQPKDSDALEKFKQKVEQAAQMAANLPDKDSPANSAAMEKMAQTLSDLSRQALDMGLSLPGLEEAIAALAASQTDQLVRDLKTTVTELEKLQTMAKALAELQAQADKMGKDLPEQLEFGQAEAARSRLAEMAEQLKSSNPDAEQMKKLMDEVERAVHPAGQYGKAAEKLKEAQAQMKDGQNVKASESLQAAAQELKDLMQQMADAQSMMASMEALQQAGMAIANGNAWRPGGKAPPRAGQGGDVGRGVGTWADDSRLMDMSDIKDRWDNSGVLRSDEEARGNTDRGDPQLADNFAPTKVKGQLNPNGPMPSITLKGVSIKGMSRVQIEEAAAAAQSSAQSALSQEQVPRAYRGAVRDYFDDLK